MKRERTGPEKIEVMQDREGESVSERGCERRIERHEGGVTAWGDCDCRIDTIGFDLIPSAWKN